MNTPRFILVLILFGAGFLTCAVKGCRLAGPERESIIARGERTARVRRSLPGKRGRILDREGKILVWSELYFDLHYNADGENELSEDEQQTLIRLFGKPDLQAGPGGVLHRHLKPEQLLALEPLLLKGAPLKVTVRHERMLCDSDAVRSLAGKVELRHGTQCGVSGWELEHELTLRGIPGEYSVLLDRFKRYMPKSFRLIAPPQDGRDVRLPQTLEELEKAPGPAEQPAQGPTAPEQTAPEQTDPEQTASEPAEGEEQ